MNIYLQISENLPADLPGLTDSATLEGAALAALQDGGAPPNAALSLVVDDDARLQALNSQFLGVDAPTDVLSFPSGEEDPDSGERYLGDVILSYPRAAAQAAAGGHSVQDELTLLAVHGALHLLGHDHAEPAEKAAMWAAQARILTALGCAAIPVDE
ncbi:MAG: rRNA maturation RNase YbeY [Chloroflexi bacterium]|nr:rRNA maturation RNase YbeY [Chloroflexota bacterium]